MITYRWIDGPTASKADWDLLDPIFAARGWMKLNIETCRILVAEEGGRLAGFVVMQLVPHLEPLFVAPSFRGTDIARELATKMVGFMHEIEARGWISIASNMHVEKLCEEQGMTRLAEPVFIGRGKPCQDS